MARNCRDVRAQAVDAGLDAAFAGDERRLRGSKPWKSPVASRWVAATKPGPSVARSSRSATASAEVGP
jgi:hypothetical protein